MQKKILFIYNDALYFTKLVILNKTMNIIKLCNIQFMIITLIKNLFKKRILLNLKT